MAEAVALDQAQVEALIATWVEECRQGRSDREAEAVALAEAVGFGVEATSERFKVARDLRGSPPLQPAQGWAERARAKLRQATGQGIVKRSITAAPAAKPDDAAALEAAIKRRAEAKAQPKIEEPKPEAEAAQEKIGLPAVIPITKPPVVAAEGRWDDAVVEMNQQHAVIDNVGGKTLIACWEPSRRDPKRRVNVFHTVLSFKLRYSNRFITIQAPGRRVGSVDQRSVPLGDYWLGHPNRAQYRGILFRPKGERIVDECLNIWQGWGVVPQAGDWGLIRWHIVNIIASGDAEFAEYLVKWIAWSIQNPDKQAEVALVLIGQKGCGKGTLGKCLKRIFGPHAFQVTSREEVIGKFNGHLEDCILFLADEAYWGGDKRCVGRLQGLITEETIPIERKGIDLYEVPNYLHVVMLAEPGWVIPAGRCERRYAAFSVSDAKRGENGREYFKALHRQIDNGGAEAMMWDLQLMDLGDWHPREIPESLLKSEALQQQQVKTLPPMEQWYLMLLHDAKLPGATDDYPIFSTNAVNRVPRLRFELGDTELRNFLTDKDRIGLIHTKDHVRTGNGWRFEPLSLCREAWERLYGPQDWETDAAEWGDLA